MAVQHLFEQMSANFQFMRSIYTGTCSDGSQKSEECDCVRRCYCCKIGPLYSPGGTRSRLLNTLGQVLGIANTVHNSRPSAINTLRSLEGKLSAPPHCMDLCGVAVHGCWGVGVQPYRNTAICSTLSSPEKPEASLDP